MATEWTFHGRQTSLETLRAMLNRNQWSFCRIQGRRRIGKTHLIRELTQSVPSLQDRLVYLQIPDSDELDVVATFNRALLDSDTTWIANLAPKARDFSSMAAVIGTLCRSNAIVVLDEFQYFARSALYAFNSHLQSVVDQLNQTKCGSLIVLGSIQTEMQALLADRGAPLYGRVTDQLDIEHWDFEDLIDVFRTHDVQEPSRWLTLWSFFEGVPKFYRDAFTAGLYSVASDKLASELLRRLFLEGARPLRDEAEIGYLREIHGKAISILTYIANNPGSLAGEITATLAKTGTPSEVSGYLTNLATKFRMIERRLPVFADVRNRHARYYLTDNFLQSALAITAPAVQSAHIRPFDSVMSRAGPRVNGHEGFSFEKLIRQLHTECSRKGKGDFALTDINVGYWNRPKDLSKSIEIDVVALNAEDRQIRFGSCKRSPEAHAKAVGKFEEHISNFLLTQEGKAVKDWHLEKVLFSPDFSEDTRRHFEGKGYRCMDLRDYAVLF
jgi:AAA+ ATPase superfamily predicted ATPase